MAKKEYTIPVAGHVVRYARTSLGLSAEEACNKLSIASDELDAIENGTQAPHISTLKGMAKLYKRSLTFLLLAETPPEKPLPRDHRTVGSTKLGPFKSKTILTVRKARALAEAQIELYRDMGSQIPAFTLKATLRDDPVVKAEALRRDLELHHLRAEGITPKNALEYTIDAITGLGVFVYQLSLTQDGLRGFSILDEERPIIVLKRGGEVPTARLFTLFHELGHVMLGEGGMCDLHGKNDESTEQWCNRFAAEALLPKAELKQHSVIKQHLAESRGMEWTKAELALVARDFHVGLEVVLRSLLSEKLTTKDFYEEHHEAWKEKAFGRSKKGQTRDTLNGKIQERGRSFVRLIFSAFDREKIGALQASRLLDVPIDRFAQARQLVA